MLICKQIVQDDQMNNFIVGVLSYAFPMCDCHHHDFCLPEHLDVPLGHVDHALPNCLHDATSQLPLFRTILSIIEAYVCLTPSCLDFNSHMAYLAFLLASLSQCMHSLNTLLCFLIIEISCTFLLSDEPLCLLPLHACLQCSTVLYLHGSIPLPHVVASLLCTLMHKLSCTCCMSLLPYRVLIAFLCDIIHKQNKEFLDYF